LSRAPGILRVKAVPVRVVMHHGRSDKNRGVDVAQQKVRQAEAAGRRIDSIHADFALRGADVQEIVAPVAILVAELEAVVSFEPGQVVQDLPNLRNLELWSPR